MELANRLYAVVNVKGIDEERREIKGIATTPSTDRMGDVVEPKGAEFKLPIPLLWQHDHRQPVGTVTSAKVTDDGIEVTASIAQVSSPAGLKARLDEAWESLKAGLVQGLSIGFSPIEYSFIDGGGIKFSKWGWHELSLVTIPANAEATITAVKNFDEAARAAFRDQAQGSKKTTAVKVGSGATEKKQPTKQTKGPEAKPMKTNEQIKSFEMALEQKRARMAELMEKAAEEGVTLDAEQSDEFDTLQAECEQVEKHIARLKALEAVKVEKATVVQTATAHEVKQFGAVAKAPLTKNGIGVAQIARCLALARGSHFVAHEIAKGMHGIDPRVPNVLKAAVTAGSTASGNWAANLVGDETSVFADFVEYLRPQTILGKFGQGGIPALRSVPFRTALLGQTGGGAGYWVGEGNAKPLTSFDFSRTTLEPLKVANIAVLTDEVIRDSSPAADAIIRDSLVAALQERLDTDFVDPDKAASAGVSPASITNGLTPVNSTGTAAANVRADIRALMADYITNNITPTSAVLIMSATTALALSLMQNPLGQSEFPGIGMSGGTLLGIPVIVSEYVGSDSNGHYVILANAGDIYYADNGGFSIDLSTEASLQMDSAPDNPTTASTVLVSMFQRNLVAFRAERSLNWSKRRAAAVSYLYGVNWGD